MRVSETVYILAKICVRSIIHPMGWPFCFCGKPNINVQPTLIMISKWYGMWCVLCLVSMWQEWCAMVKNLC